MAWRRLRIPFCGGRRGNGERGRDARWRLRRPDALLEDVHEAPHVRRVVDVVHIDVPHDLVAEPLEVMEQHGHLRGLVPAKCSQSDTSMRMHPFLIEVSLDAITDSVIDVLFTMCFPSCLCFSHDARMHPHIRIVHAVRTSLQPRGACAAEALVTARHCNLCLLAGEADDACWVSFYGRLRRCVDTDRLCGELCWSSGNDMLRVGSLVRTCFWNGRAPGVSQFRSRTYALSLDRPTVVYNALIDIKAETTPAATLYRSEEEVFA